MATILKEEEVKQPGPAMANPQQWPLVQTKAGDLNALGRAAKDEILAMIERADGADVSYLEMVVKLRGLDTKYKAMDSCEVKHICGILVTEGLISDP